MDSFFTQSTNIIAESAAIHPFDPDDILLFNIVVPEQSLSLNASSEDSMRFYECSIVATNEADETIQIGSINFVTIDFLFEAGTISPYEAFDTTGDLDVVGSALFNWRTNRLKASVSKVLDSTDPKHFLILERLIILPKWRGRGLGLLANKRVMEEFGDPMGVAVLQVCPLQFIHADSPDSPDELELHGFSGDKKSATDKLRNYYSRLGFQNLPKTNVMVFNLERQITIAPDSFK